MRVLRQGEIWIIIYSIELDEYREEIHVMGCVQKNGKWVIYKTNERNGEAHIFKEYNSEDESCWYGGRMWILADQLLPVTG